ncbi:aldose 1-epimerase [Ferruginibacter lapsinanis]|uniref:aldose 1-epimerase n=1 Tax=Ferruginibacter lapsinanis TaxID=563172 RepID=UPI001E43F046|nr:aldose 1-epimerase [Ferruginibacter lapsinanis]UEG50579.1 aldose 1-epimerase [Ferruginibacter lapsinanis]
MSFTVDNTIEDGFAKIVLKDTISDTAVEVIPSCGAILHAFTIVHNGERMNVIDHYDDANDFAQNVSSKGFKSCKLSPFACRIKNASYVFADQGYSIKKFLLGKSALHGLLYDASFEMINKHISDDHAGVSLLYQYKGTDEGYPFHYDCIITYLLQANSLLTISTDIINKDENAIPIQDGWHPYFTFNGKIDDLLLEFQSKEKMLFDSDMIPTGEKKVYEEFGSLKKIGDTKFDDCFSVNFAECQPLCVLRDKEKKIQIEIRPDKTYPYLQIYTPDHRKSIAIENLSAIPDTFNNGIGLKILQPKEKANFTTSYKITPLT